MILSENLKKKNVKFYIPVDSVIAQTIEPAAETKIVTTQEIPKGWKALDIGPASVKLFSEAIQDAKTIIERNTADDNAALMRLAERLIQQQDAAVSSPAAIRANIPDQGRVLTFKRAIVVDKRANLGIKLEANAVRTASSMMRVGILAATIVIFGLLLLAARSLRRA